MGTSADIHSEPVLTQLKRNALRFFYQHQPPYHLAEPRAHRFASRRAGLET